jgi:hypothetical protein
MLDSSLEEYTNVVGYLKRQLKNQNLSEEIIQIRLKRSNTDMRDIGMKLDAGRSYM